MRIKIRRVGVFSRRISFEVGHHEKHSVALIESKWGFQVEIFVDGASVIRISWQEFRKLPKWPLVVPIGEEERHELEVIDMGHGGSKTGTLILKLDGRDIYGRILGDPVFVYLGWGAFALGYGSFVVMTETEFNAFGITTATFSFALLALFALLAKLERRRYLDSLQSEKRINDRRFIGG